MDNGEHGRGVLAAVIAIIMMIVGLSASEAAIAASELDDGYQYLISQQLQDGRWGDASLGFIHTQEAVTAMAVMRRFDASYYRGITWLENHGASNHDATARRLLALANRQGGNASAAYTALTDTATANLSTQGSGWGLGETLAPSAYDTALVLQALSRQTPLIDATPFIDYLLDIRLANSGWEAISGEGFDLATTAFVIRALDAYRSQDVAIDTALYESAQAVAAAVDASTPVYTKSLALIAANIELPGAPQIDTWRNDLLSAQSTDGSWNQSVLATAVALQALTVTSSSYESSGAEVVVIPDANLRAAINEALGRNLGDAITRGQMAMLTSLDLFNRNITDLAGLEYAINLVSLNLNGNFVVSLAPIANLPLLTSLDVTGNPLSYFEDFDGDGFSDGAEQQFNLDPLVMDTDGDGIIDGDDPFPAYAGTPVDNTAPVAMADTTSTMSDTPVSVAVLENDTDADGDGIAVIDIYLPTFGTAAISGDGLTTVYTPFVGFFGPDSYSYRIHDGRGGFDKARVDIEVIRPNVDPQANDDEVSTRRNRTIVVAVLENDEDTDGDVITISSVTQPLNGQVTVLPDGVSVEYVPNSGFTGTDTFDYSISDGFGGTATGTVSVEVRSSFLLKIIPSIS